MQSKRVLCTVTFCLPWTVPWLIKAMTVPLSFVDEYFGEHIQHQRVLFVVMRRKAPPICRYSAFFLVKSTGILAKNAVVPACSGPAYIWLQAASVRTGWN